MVNDSQPLSAIARPHAFRPKDLAQRVLMEQSKRMSIVPRSVKKIPAGVLAIFLGSFGIHKFFLGRNNAGIAILAVYCFGWLLSWILGVGHTLMFLVHAFTIAEGIALLFKSDSDFYYQYIMGRRQWF